MFTVHIRAPRGPSGDPDVQYEYWLENYHPNDDGIFFGRDPFQYVRTINQFINAGFSTRRPARHGFAR